MDTYLVGGAVRDKLLGKKIVERDWVVVGALPQDLLDQGYTLVGKDFPVFLHPTSKEEYALARLERKVGAGHKGFICDANQNVSLVQDLARRDLTINAIAETKDGQLIDPYGGVEDIKNRVFRHVSKAFEEDPLRVIRVARFSARFPEFKISELTSLLMKQMVARDDLAELAPERIYAELDKALSTKTPSRFFEVLAVLGAGEKLWPEISIKAFQNLEKAAKLVSEKDILTAALFWFLSAKKVKALALRLKLPNQLVDLALHNQQFETWQSLADLKAEKVVSWLYTVDAFRREERFKKLISLFKLMSEIDRDNQLKQTQTDAWLDYFNLAKSVQAKDFVNEYSGAEIGKAMRSAQVNIIENAIHTSDTNSNE